MYIYNVTVNVSDDVHIEWLKWMKETHIPDVMKTGCFIAGYENGTRIALEDAIRLSKK